MRQELKYILPELEKKSLTTYLKNFMVEDPCMNLSKSYFVSSLYFDSPEMMCLSQKINGDTSKIKFRIRYYENDCSSSFLEVKKKKGQFSSKTRALCKINSSILQYGTQEISNFLNNLKAQAFEDTDFFYYYYTYKLKPVLWVHFKRIAYICPNNTGLRLTIDSSLRGHLFSSEKKINQQSISFGNNHDILEIKRTHAIPAWLDLFLKETEIEPVAFSKYFECYSALQATNSYQPQLYRSVKDR